MENLTFKKLIRISLHVIICIILFSSSIIAQNRERFLPDEGKRRFDEEFLMDKNLLRKTTKRAAKGKNVTLISRLPYGSCYALFVKDNIAYFGNSDYLEIVGISDPSNPEEISKVLLPSVVRGVYVSGNYAYVAATEKGGLRILDVSNPSNPVEVGFYDTWDVRGVYVSGDYAYVAAGNFIILDVSNPSNPVKVWSYDTEGVASGVYVSGDHAYVAAEKGGLRVIDVSNPSNPVEVGFCDTEGEAREVYVSSGYAYVADDFNGLRVIDVSNPSNPVEVGFYDNSNTRGVYVSGNYAYVATGGFTILDVSNPSNPIEVGFYRKTLGIAYRVHVSGNYAFVADWTWGLIVIDITNLSNPVEVGGYYSGGTTEGVYISGDYAYVATGRTGLRVVDISNPSNPVEVGTFHPEDGSYAQAVYVSGNYAYVADNYNGLRVIDLSNPSNPVEVGFCDTEGDPYGLYVSGDYAYVADGSYGLTIINISNPSNPIKVGSLPLWGNSLGVYVSGNLAYVACDGGGLRIISIRNPSKPDGVGWYYPLNYQGSAWEVYVSGDYAYLADGSKGLTVLDVSIPWKPVEVGSFDTNGFVIGVYVSGNYVYVADRYSYCSVLRVMYAGRYPFEVGFYYYMKGSIKGVHVSGKYIYLTDYNGLYVLKNDLIKFYFSHEAFDFGSVSIGSRKDWNNFVITNENDETITIDSIIVDSPEFFILSPQFPVDIPPQSSINVSVRFQPDSVGTKSAIMTIFTTLQDIPKKEVSLTGTCISGVKISFSNESYNFGIVSLGSSKDWNDFRISNNGSTTITIDSITVNSHEFSILSPKFPADIPPQSSLNVSVKFRPDSIGTRSATMTISISNMPTKEISLNGTGISVKGLLSGIVKNIGIDTTNKNIDSSDVVMSAYVELLQNDEIIYGPIMTDENGNFQFTDVNLGNYILHSYKIINLQNELPILKEKDTVSVYRNISICSESNVKNIILPIDLVKQKYNLISELSHLFLIVPDWDIHVPLITSYNENGVQNQLDSWTTIGINQQIREVLERLITVEILLNLVYYNAEKIGTEMVWDLIDPAFYFLSVVNLVNSIFEVIEHIPIIGDLAKWLKGQIISLILQITEEPVKWGASLLGAPYSGVIGDSYSLLVDQASEMVKEEGLDLKVLEKLAATIFGGNILGSLYVGQWTQPALEDALDYAARIEYSGSFNSAYGEMVTFNNKITTNIEQAYTTAKNIRYTANVGGNVSNLLIAVGTVPGLHVLSIIGAFVGGLSLGGYGTAIFTSGSQFFSIAPELRNEIPKIYHPGIGKPIFLAKRFSKLNFASFNKSLSDRLEKNVYASQNRYDEFLNRLMSAVYQSDTNTLQTLVQELPNIDKEFNDNLNTQASQIYAVASSAKDTIPDFMDKYNSMLINYESSLKSRFVLALQILSYIGEPTEGKRDSLITQTDTVKVSNLNVVESVINSVETVSELPSPANCIVKSQDVPSTVKSKETFKIKATIANTGAADAHNVIVTLSISPSLKLETDSTFTFGIIKSGEEIQASWTIRAKSGISKIGSWTIKILSTDAVTFSKTGVITIEEIDTGINYEPPQSVPKGFTLYQNYPNPFNLETIIRYELPKQAFVTIKIYNILGELIKTLLNEEQFPGTYTIRWNGCDDSGNQMSSGIYIYQIQAGDFVKARKMILLK